MKKLLVCICAILLTSPLLAMEKDDSLLKDPNAEMSRQIAQRYKKKTEDLNVFLHLHEEKAFQGISFKDESKEEDTEEHTAYADIGSIPLDPNSSLSSKHFKEACLANKEHIDNMIYIFENHQYYIKLKNLFDIKLDCPLEQIFDPDLFKKHLQVEPSYYSYGESPIRLIRYVLTRDNENPVKYCQQTWKTEINGYLKINVCLDIDQIVKDRSQYMLKGIGGNRNNIPLTNPNMKKLNDIKSAISSIFGSDLKMEEEKLSTWLSSIQRPLRQKTYLIRSLEWKFQKSILRGIVDEKNIKKQAKLKEEIEELKKEEKVLRLFFEVIPLPARSFTNL